MLYSLARPMLFSLAPERAHEPSNNDRISDLNKNMVEAKQIYQSVIKK
jgi:hypothetical protein